MNQNTRRIPVLIFGVIICLFSAASLVGSGYALIKTWQIQAEISRKLLNATTEAQAVLKNAGDGLQTTAQTISATINTLSALRPTLLSVSNGVHSAEPAFDEIQTITAENLPETITATQASLLSAQQSAAAMEGVLRLVSQIPFFPGGTYDPDVSLETSLRYLSDDIEALRDPLENMQAAIGDAQDSLDGLDNQIMKLILLLDQIRYNLETANQKVADSREQVLDAQIRLQELEPLIPVWVSSGAYLLSFLLIWVGMTQISWIIQGVKWCLGK